MILISGLFVLTSLGCFVGCGLGTPGQKKSASESQEKRPVANVPLADPFILLHDGTYYAYGTGAENGIPVWVSDDLQTWHKAPGRATEGLSLQQDDVYGDRWCFAPEVYCVDGIFYMFFSAQSRICVAVADSPLGPFVQREKKPMIEGEKCIDNTLFIDDDGRKYMYFDRFNDGLNIWVCELESNLLGIKPGTMQKCIHVSQEWETVWPRVNEGCFVIKHTGIYYMTYSANSYERPNYGVGCATAESPAGPWAKYDHNPLLQFPGDLVGVGHSAMFKDKSGRLRIVFHAHHSKEKIHPRNMFISNVLFRYRDGAYMMEIDKSYMVPQVAEPVENGNPQS